MSKFSKLLYIVLPTSCRVPSNNTNLCVFQEPIELSHYPSAYKPPPGTKPKIERDDFPAPPYPYTDPGNEITITKN